MCLNVSPADAAPQAPFYAKAADALADRVKPDAADLDDTLDIPPLHSNPNSEHKIYLDFDGQTVSWTPWNLHNNSKPIHAPAFSVDDDIFTFNADEIDRVIEAWERVSEDFSPFDVDVTTEEPDLSVFTDAKGIRVIVSVSIDDARLGGAGEDWFDQASGVAYLDSWS